MLSLKGADLIVNISAVPREFPVDYMWRRFVGAAIYNQVFVVYANRPGRFFSGHSGVFSLHIHSLVETFSQKENCP